MFIKLIIFFFLLLPATTIAAVQDYSITLGNGDEIPIARYPADGQTLLLWLPSEFGLSPRQAPTAEHLAARGVETWIPDLHSAWFIPAGRYSLNDINPSAIATLIGKAVASGKMVYLMAAGRTTALALRGLRHYQLNHATTDTIRGLISIGPRLFVRTPQGGEAAGFLPIASASNIPIYILQPRNTGGFWRVGKTRDELERGGSPVFIQILDGVRDGFNLRSEFTPQEQATTEHLPGIIIQAMRQLDAYGGLPASPAALAGKDIAPEADHGSSLLRPYKRKAQAPGLELERLSGGHADLSSLKGRVVLVNFWATWCPPCVKEIPSLQRLYTARKRQGLEILAVDVGELHKQVADFLSDKPVDFPVLLDTEGQQLKHWGVHAFPTTFVLDRSQRIRYAGFGAFAWDSPEVLKTLDALLAEPRPTPAVREKPVAD